MDAKERFAARLGEALKPENAYNADINPFAGQLQAKREAYVQNAMNAWRADPANASKTNADNNVQAAALAKQFDEKTLPGETEAIKKRAVAAYNGDSDQQAVAAGTENMVGSIGTGAVAGLMNGDPMGGISHTVRHSFIGFLMGIPFVGQFLAQIMNFVGGNVSAVFGGNDWVGWSEAGDKARRTKAKERLAATFGQSANMDKLGQMVDDSTREPTAEETAKAAQEKVAREQAEKQRQAEAAAAAEAKKNGGQVTGGQPTDPAAPKVPTPPSTETTTPPTEQQPAATR